ncbi:uncharacterized protein LOC126797395 [Argentina anserina]|uniref:uncharacterized protein LOC126797395 n=1 Tax=Argentina anserina TaxID=57926 RepID=UPI00217668A7|nr:uncharacterized protein LOC126797395 [Potentilla anserina]
MVEAVTLCQPSFILGRGLPFCSEKLKVKMKDRRCHYAKAVLNSKQEPKKDHNKPFTVNLSSTSDAPLYESLEVTFDQYMEDQKRVIKALFPDAQDLKLHKKEWRIQLPTMQLLFMSFYFAFYIKLRYKSMGKDYPPHVPHHIPKIIELELTRWELGGISEEYQPGDLSLSLKGTIYPDRKQGTQSRLKGQFDMNLSFIVSPLLGWVPQSVMQGLTEALVKTAMVDSTSNARLLEDYDEFKREKLKNVV